MEVKWLRSQLNNQRTDSKREAEIKPNSQGNLCGPTFQNPLDYDYLSRAQLIKMLYHE